MKYKQHFSCVLKFTLSSNCSRLHLGTFSGLSCFTPCPILFSSIFFSISLTFQSVFSIFPAMAIQLHKWQTHTYPANNKQSVTTILYLLHVADLSVSSQRLCPSASPPKFLSGLINLYPRHLYELLLTSVLHDPNDEWGKKQQILFLYATVSLFCWINWYSPKANAPFKNLCYFEKYTTFLTTHKHIYTVTRTDIMQHLHT